METKNGKVPVTYEYVKTVNGEYIYKSNHSAGQEYVLQKHGEEFALIQYEFNEGYEVPDVKGNEKGKEEKEEGEG